MIIIIMMIIIIIKFKYIKKYRNHILRNKRYNFL